MIVSTDYRRLDPSEVSAIAAECDKAWQDAAIPLRQWASCVRGELERFRAGERQPHFDILVDMLKQTGLDNPRLLDVGAASGFYSEVIRRGGFSCRYTACDYSPHFARMAEDLFPGIDFKVGDARALPFADNSFEVLISGCVILHVADYEKVISESARVAAKFCVFNRTPVTIETSHWVKSAYGVRCLEIHFGEQELLGLFAKYGLTVVAQKDIFTDKETQYGHRTYLLRKENK